MSNSANKETNGLLPTTEEVLLNEDELLKGMLECSQIKENTENVKPIQIVRQDKVKFAFKVRGLTQDEIVACRKKATKFYPNPAGAKYAKIEGEMDSAKYLSHLILTATLAEDYKKTWGNPKLKEALGVIDEASLPDKLLLAGEKIRVSDVIMTLSGMDLDEEDVTTIEYAKNS
jgi:hypothetical protein